MIDYIRSPLTAIVVVASAIGQLSVGLLDPLWSLLSTTSAFWFPAVATAGSTILPEFGYADLGTKILLGAAIVFVGVQVDRLIDSIQKWYKNR